MWVLTPHSDPQGSTAGRDGRGHAGGRWHAGGVLSQKGRSRSVPWAALAWMEGGPAALGSCQLLGFSSFKNVSRQSRLTAQSTEEDTENGIHLFIRQVAMEFEAPRSDYESVRLTLPSAASHSQMHWASVPTSHPHSLLLTKQSLDCQLILTANPPADWKNKYIS